MAITTGFKFVFIRYLLKVFLLHITHVQWSGPARRSFTLPASTSGSPPPTIPPARSAEIYSRANHSQKIYIAQHQIFTSHTHAVHLHSLIYDNLGRPTKKTRKANSDKQKIRFYCWFILSLSIFQTKKIWFIVILNNCIIYSFFQTKMVLE